jgi:hypothetical protein
MAVSLNSCGSSQKDFIVLLSGLMRGCEMIDDTSRLHPDCDGDIDGRSSHDS